MPADLHLHSIYSDGTFTPTSLIEMASEKGLDTVALADHDTVEGVSEMITAGKERGVDVIPAIEFSTYQEGTEIHILGYFIDYQSGDFLEKVEKLYGMRKERAKKMIERLNTLGIKISYQKVEELAGSEYIGRPHIARAMVEAGYIKEMKDAFTVKYIGNGGKAYIPKYNLSTAEAIGIIRDYGGIAVLAHPFFVSGRASMDRQAIQFLVESGLEGLEVYHSKHSKEISAYYLEIARELGLLVTGGSDFHGENSPGVKIGDLLLADGYIRGLREYKMQRKR